jgi:hypothetical protein
MPMLTLSNRAIRPATRIIHSAMLGDEERLNTAVREVLDSYRLADAMEHVFDPAIACLEGPARRRASVAIGGQLAGEPPRLGRPAASRRSRGAGKRADYQRGGTPHTRLVRVLCTGSF